MKLVALLGSLKNESKSTKGLLVAAEAARKAGAEVMVWSLRERPLPIYDPESEKSEENIQEFVKVMSEADGFLISSPEYHNGPSGVLKNALDFVGGAQFAGKPVGLVAAAGGAIATNTLVQLATILRSLHGYVIPQQGSVGYADAFNEDGTFQNPQMQERFEKIGTDVVALTKALRASRMRDAVLLIAHGSPVPAANVDLLAMVEQVRARRGDVVVEPAFLEGTSPSIPEGIATCVRQGVQRVAVIPFFLLPGSHVSEDLPAFVEAARAEYPGVEFVLGESLGSHTLLREIVWERICELDHE